MNCIICGKEFDDMICPRCAFPVIEFPGDYEEGLRALRPTIENFRAKFFNSIFAGITVYYGTDENGQVVAGKKEVLPFGNLNDIIGKECWLEQRFARLPDAETLTLNVTLRQGDAIREKEVTLPNLTDPAFQNVGITSDGNSFSLLLRNDAGKISRSSALPLFDD